MKSFVDDQVSTRGYSTPSEYVRELIRKDHDRQRLRGLLLEGVASAQALAGDADYFDRLRCRVLEANRQWAANQSSFASGLVPLCARTGSSRSALPDR